MQSMKLVFLSLVLSMTMVAASVAMYMFLVLIMHQDPNHSIDLARDGCEVIIIFNYCAMGVLYCLLVQYEICMTEDRMDENCSTHDMLCGDLFGYLSL